MKKPFKVGDQVFHMGYGLGKVTGIDPSCEFPLTVEFEQKDNDGDDIQDFSLDGKWQSCELNPTLMMADEARVLGLVKNIPRTFWFIVETDTATPEGFTLSHPYKTESEALHDADLDAQVLPLTVRF